MCTVGQDILLSLELFFNFFFLLIIPRLNFKPYNPAWQFYQTTLSFRPSSLSFSFSFFSLATCPLIITSQALFNVSK